MKYPLIRRNIIKKLFIPYLFFLTSFLYYSTYVFEIMNPTTDSTITNYTNSTNDTLFLNYTTYSLDETVSNSSFTSIWDLSNPLFWVQNQTYVFKVIIMGLAFYFVMIETRQFLIEGPKYFASPWNYIDVIPLVTISISMSIESIYSWPEIERPLNALSSFFMWMKFLYFMRLFRQTSKFISMIIAVIGDMRDFFAVFIITLIGFS